MNTEYLDDITYIEGVHHLQMGLWHQFDILLDAQGYGWEYMLDSADYMAAADLRNITEVKTGDMQLSNIDLTASFHEHNGKFSEMPELKQEFGFLSIAGTSEVTGLPMKIVWMNQTRILRLFTLSEDELLIRKYIETVIRRSFGSADAMKIGRTRTVKNTEIDIRTSLFLIPVAFEDDTGLPAEPDHELHFGVHEAQMAQIGSRLACDDLPQYYTHARTSKSRIMHYQTLKNPDGKRYIPLFSSYDHIKSIFGNNNRLGVICFETATELVLKENLDGIVVSPGSQNIIISRKELSAGEYLCITNESVEKLRTAVERGNLSADETARRILDINNSFKHCDECMLCRKINKRKPAELITKTAKEITDILSCLNLEQYVDVINILSDHLEDKESANHERSVLPELIDNYETRLKNELMEQTNILRKAARKMELKIEWMPLYTGWCDGFIQRTDEWFRYFRPLIKLAASRRTENSLFNESIECIKELIKKSMFDNDKAAYKLTAAFMERFADVPSFAAWLKYYNDWAGEHLDWVDRLNPLSGKRKKDNQQAHCEEIDVQIQVEDHDEHKKTPKDRDHQMNNRKIVKDRIPLSYRRICKISEISIPEDTSTKSWIELYQCEETGKYYIYYEARLFSSQFATGSIPINRFYMEISEEERNAPKEELIQLVDSIRV